MTRLAFFFLTMICSFYVSGQSIHEFEPIKNHYKRLESLSNSARPSSSELDKIKYPLENRSSGRQFIGLEPSYLSKEQVNTLKSSVQFPANSSEQARAELDYLLQLQSSRTDSQKKRAREIAPIGYWPPMEKTSGYYGSNLEDLFWEYREVAGREGLSKDYPATTRLLAGVTRDMRIMEFTVKYHFLRPRPYHLESRLTPMARISNPSFASGHTLWAYIQAFTWSELIPSKRNEFLATAYEVGESREIMGIHYPSDEEAARVLAHKMLSAMWENSEFLRDLEAAKREWK